MIKRFSIPAIALMVVFYGFGIGKLLDLGTFRSNLDTWSIVPSWGRTPIAILIPFAEVCLATSLACWSRSRRVYLLACFFVSILTIVYVVQFLVMGPPKCGCFGVFAKYSEESGRVWPTILRNFLIIAAAAWGFLASHRQTATESAFYETRRRQQYPPNPEKAFTVIELLVCICIFSIVLAIAIPSLKSSLSQSRHAARISKLSSHGKAIVLYQGDYRDFFPHFMQHDRHTKIRVGSISVTGVFFDSKWMWYALLINRYYSNELSLSPFVGPGKNRVAVPLDFWFSSTLVSGPEFWNQLTRVGPSQWTGVQGSDVRFPSSKVVFANHGEFADVESRRPVMFTMTTADGGVSSIGEVEEIAPYPLGEGHWFGSTLDTGYLGIHTVGGARGRDFVRK